MKVTVKQAEPIVPPKEYVITLTEHEAKMVEIHLSGLYKGILCDMCDSLRDAGVK